MKRFLPILLIVLAAPNAWASFAYRKSITVNSGQVTGTLTNFTQDVSETDPDLQLHVLNASGYDIGYYTNTDCSTGKMKWATLYWDGTTGAHHHKILVASMVDGALFYECYGDAAIVTDQSDPTNAVDASTKGLWALANGTTLNVTDVTGVNNGTNNSGTATAGKVDGGLALTGTAYVDVGNNASLQLTTSFTLMAWVKVTDLGQYHLILGKSSDAGVAAPYYAFVNPTDGVVYWSVGNGTTETLRTSSAVTAGTWYHVALTYDGTTMRPYFNGAATATSAPSQALGDGGKTARIGNRQDGINFKGSIDEPGIDTGVRSAGWIASKYRNQNAPSTFYALGSEVSLGGTSHNNSMTLGMGH